MMLSTVLNIESDSLYHDLVLRTYFLYMSVNIYRESSEHLDLSLTMYFSYYLVINLGPSKLLYSHS